MIEYFGIVIILIIGFVKISWTLDDIKNELIKNKTDNTNRLLNDIEKNTKRNSDLQQNYNKAYHIK